MMLGLLMINLFISFKFIHKNSLNDNVCAQNPLYS